MHNHVITRNPRISVTHDKHDKHKTWYLQIANVQEEDKGRYMCQINTVTAKTQFGYLSVVGEYDIELAALVFVLPLVVSVHCCCCCCCAFYHVRTRKKQSCHLAALFITFVLHTHSSLYIRVAVVIPLLPFVAAVACWKKKQNKYIFHNLFASRSSVQRHISCWFPLIK